MKSGASTTDPSHDIFRSERQPLEAIFAPRTVAVVGASEDAESVGRTLLWNLLSNPFGGSVYPVNPGRTSVLGVRAYPNVATVPEQVDLAVVATPAPTVPGIISECVDAGVGGAIVVSAGFREVGEAGAELERQILEQARHGRLRLLGPNCLGVMRPFTGLNATFAGAMALPGNVGFISQSGALGTAILDWSLRENVGFSYFVSVGSMLDVGWGDLIYRLGDDPRTRSIVVYMETIGDARHFLSAAREVALTKPIIVLKVGHTEAAAKAAASHTGALTGSDEVLDAAFRRCGVLRVRSIADLFDMAETLAKQPRSKGPRLTVVTNAGGPGVLATDALEDAGGELAELSEETLETLDLFLPDHWSHGNPIDILGDAEPARYTQALEVATKDPGSDGLLVILTPQAMSDPTGTAERLKPYVKTGRKPLLASWMGGTEVATGEEILNRAGISTFDYPDTAAKMFSYMWRYAYNLRSLYETPTVPEDSVFDRAQAEKVIEAARGSGRTLLTETESEEILAAYGIPVLATLIAKDEAEAVEEADRIGYPVVLKLFSETVTHKTDVGGVRLNLGDALAVRHAFQQIEASVRETVGLEHFLGVTVQPMVEAEGYELIVGSSIDRQFGPVLLFGSGGQLVEVFEDRALALPPLNSTLARRMMEQTHIYTALKGVRGREPVDLSALEQLVVRFGQLIVEQRWVKEIDINPLLASAEGLIVLDARVVLQGPDVEAEELPRLAIRPYPARYVTPWKMKDGTLLTIRPIRPEDEPLMVKFNETLSERSVYYRYFQALKLSRRVAHEFLARACFIDYDREMALVADRRDPKTEAREIVAVGRLSKLHARNEAEIAVLVSDRYQGHGLGTELLRLLIEIGRDENLGRIVADILPANHVMRRIARKLGFSLRRTVEEGVVKATVDL